MWTTSRFERLMCYGGERELNDVSIKLNEEKKMSKRLKKNLAEQKNHSKNIEDENTWLMKEIRRLEDLQIS